MLRIDGIMTGRNRMFDTPGVPHNHQLSARLTPDEVSQAITQDFACLVYFGIIGLHSSVAACDMRKTSDSGIDCLIVLLKYLLIYL